MARRSSPPKPTLVLFVRHGQTPTTGATLPGRAPGLHLADIDRLLQVLHRLADQGHTIVIIEHQLDVIRSADWIIDMGPEGGPDGGLVVAEGTPERVSRARGSHTGAHLEPLLAPRGRGRRSAAKSGARKASRGG